MTKLPSVNSIIKIIDNQEQGIKSLGSPIPEETSQIAKKLDKMVKEKLPGIKENKNETNFKFDV